VHENVLVPRGVTDRKMSLETTCHAVLEQLNEVCSCGSGVRLAAAPDTRSISHSVSPGGGRSGAGGVCGQDRV
jgi:hypothetical protein